MLMLFSLHKPHQASKVCNISKSACQASKPMTLWSSSSIAFCPRECALLNSTELMRALSHPCSNAHA